MNAKQISELVWKEAEVFAEAADCVIWDVKFVKEAGQWFLKVYIDTKNSGNVSIDMCEAVNRGLDKRLDELDPIEQGYYLEVSSPGLTRELSRPGDFDKFLGSSVDIKLYKANPDGEKSFTAILSARDGDELILLRDGNAVKYPLTDIASCKIHYEF